MDEKDIKSIEQLIKFLNEKYLVSQDSTNYGDELESMREMKKVPSIVKKCKNTKYKIKWPPYNFCNDNMLWAYLNECIIRCYERSNHTSTKFFRDAYINVRKVGNETSIKQRLIEIATSRGVDVSETCCKIDEAWGKYFNYKKEISNYSWDTNGYNQILPKIKAVGNWLIDNNYVPSLCYWDSLSSSDIEATVFFDYCKLEKDELELDEKIKLSKNDALWGCGGVIGIVLLLVGIAYFPFITIGIVALIIIIVLFLKYRNKIKAE